MNRSRWRWQHWTTFGRSDALVAVAAVVVAATIVAVWRGEVLRPWAGPGFTPVLPLSIGLGLLVGSRHLGLRRRDRRAWAPTFGLLATALAVTAATFVAQVGPPTEAFAFLVGALEEELVFRLALPLATGGITALVLGRPGADPARWGTAPRVVALVTAGIAFVVMPGHLDQMDHLLAAIPFAATALLFTYVVLRTGALLPGVLAHAALNLATACFLAGAISRPLWSLAVVVVLAAYARGSEVAGRRLGYLQPTGVFPRSGSYASAPASPAEPSHVRVLPHR